jgi:hypothetical protein
MNDNELIFETILAEASFRLAEKTITGIALDEAIREVSSEMELNKPEVEELHMRSKKLAPPQVVEDDLDINDVMDDMGDDADPKDGVETMDNTISFGSAEELETAMGVLMYKGIPWVHRDVTSVTFMTPDQVRDAHEALKRRWDFINHDDRTVATIEFDNVADYEKVLEFIASKNMTLLLSDANDLTGDLEQELAEADADHKRARKAAREAGLPDPEVPSHNMSYRALHKDKLTDPRSLQPLTDNDARSVRVVKRWK